MSAVVAAGGAASPAGCDRLQICNLTTGSADGEHLGCTLTTDRQRSMIRRRHTGRRAGCQRPTHAISSLAPKPGQVAECGAWSNVRPRSELAYCWAALPG